LLHTLFIVAAGWLVLDVLVFGFLLVTGLIRARRRKPQGDVTEDLLAACPIGREPEATPLKVRARTRFRRGEEEESTRPLAPDRRPVSHPPRPGE